MPDAIHDITAQDILPTLRRVGEARIRALADEVDRSQTFSPELWALLCEIGLPSIPFPAEQDGLGGSFETFVAAVEEIAVHGACAALYAGPTVQVARAIMAHGTPAQKEGVGRSLVAGGKLGAWSFTEPQTGSDPKQLLTWAKSDGDGWVLNGSKMFTSFAPHADYALVFARTSETRLGAFIVNTTNPGWKPGAPIRMMAMGGQGTCPVAIDDLRLPAEALLGAPDEGFDIFIGNEAEGKVRASAICVGIGQRALIESVRYASERQHRGQGIGDKFPTVQVTLGEMSAQVEGARAVCRAAAAAIDAGAPSVKRLAASTRILCARMAREVTGAALQVCGAYGLTGEMVLERLYREGKFYEVGQGVIELQKIIVGKARLKEWAENGSLADGSEP